MSDKRVQVTVRDVKPAAFISAFAEHLKNKDNFEVPKWADIIKTGIHKEQSPYDPDWYYIRAASIARKVYMRQGVGLTTMRREYGGAQRRGAKKQKFVLASGGVIRHILKQFEDKLKYVEKDKNGGRKITREGQTALDRVASSIVNDASDE